VNCQNEARPKLGACAVAHPRANMRLVPVEDMFDGDQDTRSPSKLIRMAGQVR